MSNREPPQLLLRARDVRAWLKVTRQELADWCEIYPEIMFMKLRKRGKHSRGCYPYYRKHVIKSKILGINDD